MEVSVAQFLVGVPFGVMVMWLLWLLVLLIDSRAAAFFGLILAVIAIAIKYGWI